MFTPVLYPERKLLTLECDTYCRATLHTPQPKAAYILYSTAAIVDKKNVDRQDNINKERKLYTKYVSMHINMSLVATNTFDSYRAYSQATGNEDPQGRFYIDFVEQLIENNYDVIEKVSEIHCINYCN